MILNAFSIIGKSSDSGGSQTADGCHLFTGETFAQGAAGQHMHDSIPFRQFPDILHLGGVVRHGAGVGHGNDRGETAGGGSHGTGADRFRIHFAGLAQMHMHVDETGGDHFAGQIQFFRFHALHGGFVHQDAVFDIHIAHFVDVVDGVDDPGAGKDPVVLFFHHHFNAPATRKRTAIRTASPLVTCSRMTDWGPSAMAESSSTPRLMGPGCMIRASGEMYFMLSGLIP